MKKIVTVLLTLVLLLNARMLKPVMAEGDEMAEAVSETELAPAVEEKEVSYPLTLTIHYCGLKMTNGSEKEMTDSNKFSSEKSGWNLLQKKFENKIPSKKFSYAGVTYEYANQWVDGNGNLVSFPLSFKGSDFTEDTDLYFYPVYNVIQPAILQFNYIDNVSYGSGSWSNVGAPFNGMTHTFKEPAAQAHYQFLYWINYETNETFVAGDKKTVSKNDIPQGETTAMNIYAVWQPSVTVNYYDDMGKLIDSAESFSEISLYSLKGDNRGNEIFGGWSYEKGGDILDEISFYAPEITTDKVSQKVINVYGVWKADYSIEYCIEELDGSYSVRETETVKGALVNSEVKAQIREFEGFTFDDSIEGTLLSDKVRSDLVLKVYYTRNSYEVSYSIENAPENSSAMPEARMYKFEEPVTVEENAVCEGYTFSGWDKEDFTMPAEAVVISGSFEINKYTVTWVDHDGNVLEVDENVEHGTMASYDGETPVREADGSFTYEFASWTPEITEVTKDTIYTAEYEATKIVIAREIPADPSNDEPVQNKPAKKVSEKPAPVIEEKVEEPVIVEVPVIEKADNTVEITVMPEETAPMAINNDTWALINLISTIGTSLIALGMIVTMKKNKEENDEENDEEKKERRHYGKASGILAAVLSTVIFLMTEDMSARMVLIDRYTIAMVAILALTAAFAFLTRNRENSEDELVLAE